MNLLILLANALQGSPPVSGSSMCMLNNAGLEKSQVMFPNVFFSCFELVTYPCEDLPSFAVVA